jgi:type VI secretion system protein ImpM
MPAGLYGKLPAKRDFVAANVSRRLLEVWEPWLQASVATSRQMLGEAWRDAYNSAPIWRFWLGAGLCGEAVLGAFMASIDGVGRQFPLTVFATEGEEDLLPPELEPNNAWCEAAETILLDALGQDGEFEGVAAAVSSMAPPAMQPRASDAPGIIQLAEGGVVVRDFGAELAVAFRAARRFGHRQTYAAQSFWWTIGGEGFSPTALVATGLPAPMRFADMLTGAFEDSSKETV